MLSCFKVFSFLAFLYFCTIFVAISVFLCGIWELMEMAGCRAQCAFSKCRCPLVHTSALVPSLIGHDLYCTIL